MTMPLLTLEVRHEADIVLARQRARQIAAALGFIQLDQTRIATATSEIARNAFQYASGGRVEFLVEAKPPGLLIRVRERGPGIKDLWAILDGQYASPTGLGLGILGAKRLMDRFEIESNDGGATVTMTKSLPKRTAPFTSVDLARASIELTQNKPLGLLEELQQQNQELLRALQELRDRQAEIAELHNRELQETNRGVVALYTELDENANSLRKISELKSRFLSNMSHEFRSPLNTILSLTSFLMDGSSGELSDVQKREITYIRRAAEGLSAIVNDLLDLAKVEAGKAVIRSEPFKIRDLFEGLRGTIRPLLAKDSVSLIFEEIVGVTGMETDEGKLGQILRNFLSNAVKFTESGDIRVSACPGPADTVIFSVADTGLGIEAGDQERIFEEYSQVEGPFQRKVSGTGLGLPLARKLAELLGGTVSVQSELGVGSTFFAVIPRIYPSLEDSDRPKPKSRIGAIQQAGSLKKILIIDDKEIDRRQLKGILFTYGQFAIIEATNGQGGLERAHSERPSLIFLDLVMPGLTGFETLDYLKADAETRDIPIIINTSLIMDNEQLKRLEVSAAAILSKADLSRAQSLTTLREVLLRSGLVTSPVDSET